MHPKKTYELSLVFAGEGAEATKQAVIHWLIGFGEESFVEGEIANIDIDFDYSEQSLDQYDDLGGNATPIKIYRYDLEYLRDLKARLQNVFGHSLQTEERALDTEVWMEGWKESFHPIETEQFYVFPPWEASNKPAGKFAIEIEPGMAFGTGQHATTQLCLQLMERHCRQPDAQDEALDVGTGTGILAIGLRKLGWQKIMATDIDPDAVHAAADNARRNHMELTLKRDSVPAGASRQYKLVVANILAVVLRKLLPELAKAATAGGYVIMSGILQEERDDMLQRSSVAGLVLQDEISKDGWWSVLLQKQE